MRISELSAMTEVPIGTIKYYLREGLLPAGRRGSRTTAEYDAVHVERLRLVRALIETGDLGIAAVRRVLTVIDAPHPQRLDVLATAQDALTSADDASAGTPAGQPAALPTEPLAEPPAGPPAGPQTGPSAAKSAERSEESPRKLLEGVPVGRARAWVEARRWPTGPQDPVVDRLEKAWRACEAAGIDVDESMMADYADAVLQVARVDVAAVPVGADDAVRRVVIGTIMLEPVLAALRLLAQREVAVRRDGLEGRER